MLSTFFKSSSETLLSVPVNLVIASHASCTFETPWRPAVARKLLSFVKVSGGIDPPSVVVKKQSSQFFGVSDGVSEGVSDGVSDGVSEGVSDGVSEGVSEGEYGRIWSIWSIWSL